MQNVAMSEQKSSKPGRKKINFTDEDLANIERWSGDGLSEAQIATLLGCSLSTIARKKREKGRFDTALKKGKTRAVQQVANQVFQNAMNGKETSAIFFLKNRDPDNWADRQEVQHNLNLSNVLQDARTRIIEGHKIERLDKKDQFLLTDNDSSQDN
jgi:IS30 family transposase